MHMYDLQSLSYNLRYNWSILYHQFILNKYIPVSYTNGQSIKNMIGMVANSLVGILSSESKRYITSTN